MSKTKYKGEFEINASASMLYPYINTADGLAVWFAEDVNFDPRKNFVFVWNGEKSFAKKTASRYNEYVKYEFLDDNGKPVKDPSYIELSIEENEMTQTSFIVITDYSEIDNFDDMDEVYGNYVQTLKDIVGG